MLTILEKEKSTNVQLLVIKAHHPGIYISILRIMSKKEIIEEHKTECENNSKLYTAYILFHLEPMLEELNTQNKLHHGKKTCET